MCESKAWKETLCKRKKQKWNMHRNEHVAVTGLKLYPAKINVVLIVVLIFDFSVENSEEQIWTEWQNFREMDWIAAKVGRNSSRLKFISKYLSLGSTDCIDKTLLTIKWLMENLFSLNVRSNFLFLQLPYETFTFPPPCNYLFIFWGGKV